MDAVLNMKTVYVLQKINVGNGEGSRTLKSLYYTFLTTFIILFKNDVSTTTGLHRDLQPVEVDERFGRAMRKLII